MTFAAGIVLITVMLAAGFAQQAFLKELARREGVVRRDYWSWLALARERPLALFPAMLATTKRNLTALFTRSQMPDIENRRRVALVATTLEIVVLLWIAFVPASGHL